MLRITSFNANGIRAAARKGFFTWLRAESPDVLCIQETKAQEHQVPPEALDLDAYPAYAFVDAQKKGIAGSPSMRNARPIGSFAASACRTWTWKGATCASIGAT